MAGISRKKRTELQFGAYDLVVCQIGALYGFVKAEGGKIQHVKPHGALFNMAAKNAALSEAIAEAVYKFDPEIILFGLAGSELVKAGKKIGLRSASEVFSDRTYQDDGSLTPRNESNALIKDHTAAVNQVIRMVRDGKILSLQGNDVPIKADTVCIHGDGEHALKFAKYISSSLKDAGIDVVKISQFVK
jgi:5-oxoprolinase (ATP-hydrolysing) subunit A